MVLTALFQTHTRGAASICHPVGVDRTRRTVATIIASRPLRPSTRAKVRIGRRNHLRAMTRPANHPAIAGESVSAIAAVAAPKIVMSCARESRSERPVLRLTAWAASNQVQAMLALLNGPRIRG